MRSTLFKTLNMEAAPCHGGGNMRYELLAFAVAYLREASLAQVISHAWSTCESGLVMAFLFSSWKCAKARYEGRVHSVSIARYHPLRNHVWVELDLAERTSAQFTGTDAEVADLCRIVFPPDRCGEIAATFGLADAP